MPFNDIYFVLVLTIFISQVDKIINLPQATNSNKNGYFCVTKNIKYGFIYIFYKNTIYTWLNITLQDFNFCILVSIYYKYIEKLSRSKKINYSGSFFGLDKPNYNKCIVFYQSQYFTFFMEQVTEISLFHYIYKFQYFANHYRLTMNSVAKMQTNDIPPLVHYSSPNNQKTPISSLYQSFVDSQIIHHESPQKSTSNPTINQLLQKKQSKRSVQQHFSTTIARKYHSKNNSDSIFDQLRTTHKGNSRNSPKQYVTKSKSKKKYNQNYQQQQKIQKSPKSPKRKLIKNNSLSQFAINILQQALTQNGQKQQCFRQKSLQQLISLIFSNEERLGSHLTHLQYLILKHNDQKVYKNLEILSCLLIKTLTKTQQQKPKLTIRQQKVEIDFGSPTKRRQNQLKIYQLRQKHQTKKNQLMNTYRSCEQIVNNLAQTVQNLADKKQKQTQSIAKPVDSKSLTARLLRKNTFGLTQSIPGFKKLSDQQFITHYI